MKKVIFVDGNHLAHRCGYAHSELTYGNEPVGMMYGFFTSIKKIRQEYPLHHIAIAWDAGHARRDQESLEGVKNGLIPATYKANRPENPTQEENLVKWQINRQWNALRRGLKHTSCQQLRKKGFEADDVIGAYVTNREEDSIILTSDKDYYQLLEPGVVMVDPIKEIHMDHEWFINKFGLSSPLQWIEVGALAGDDGDNIFGVDGVGEGTAIKLLKKYGTLEKVFEGLREEASTRKDQPKRHQAILKNEDRVWLACSLKMIDTEIPDLPQLARNRGNGYDLEEFFNEFGFDTLLGSIETLVL